MTDEVYYLSIRELAALLRAKEISPVEIIDVCLARIDTLNQGLNAFITVLHDQARERAKKAEVEIRAGHWRGPLHGVPIGIKDFYDTANIRTTAAFERFKNRVPQRDAVSVATLQEAGAIVIGKTNMHQLGMGTTGLDSYFGPVRNPWNEEYIPGGSSSGSAAAVATGMCYATLDTDAVGSCRLPAACCGVIGFKGTYGLISANGILEGEKADEAILWLLHPGITTRTVEDTAIVVKAVSEPRVPVRILDLAADTSRANRLRVGVADNFKADRQVTAAFKAAIEMIRNAGHEAVPAHAPFDLPPFGDLRSIEADRKTIADRAFTDVDVLLLPTTATTVLAAKDAASNAQALSPENTMFANYFGLPAISVPSGFDEHGLPLGLQIVGKPWGDETVLTLAHQYQIRTELSTTHPVR
jgi:aspartyl-tRNA(Asn)/glutamyl-tRNA(Gln) amidotransferase subunit A